jgi:hypothetical protein
MRKAVLISRTAEITSSPANTNERSAPSLARPVGEPDPSRAQRNRDWMLGLLRALAYGNPFTPVPFIAPTTRERRSSR